MAFKQYTHCVDFDAFKKHWQGSSQSAVAPLFFNALSHAFLYMIVGAISGAGIGALFGGVGAAVGAATGAYIGFSYGFVDGFCDQWLNWRLICVQRDQCAAGRVAWIETAGAKFGHDPIEWLFDNDLSFNLRLTPYNGKKMSALQFPPDSAPETYGIAQISADPFPSSQLLRKPRKADGTDWDLSYEGYEGTGSDAKPDHPGGRWTLHSEIEGNGMDLLCTIAKVIAALGPLGAAAGIVAGAIVGAIAGAVIGYQTVHSGCKKHCHIPILCDVVCFLAGVAAAIVLGFVGFWVGAVAGAIPGLGAILLGGLIGLFVRHNGSFDDVKNDPESGTIEEEDTVFIFGDQVYDAGHSDGWVEIHPVKHLQKIVPPVDPAELTDSPHFKDLGFIADVETFWNTWCEAVRVGRKASTVAAQQDPQNIWCLHPMIDGCQPSEPPIK